MTPQTVRVLGGGPAGATAARLLASWGHDVHLITRPSGDSRLAVSLPPSTAKLFDTIGVSAAIERAGFIRSAGNTVWWGGAEPRVEPFAQGARGWQVDLARFSETLLACAADAGVQVERRVAEVNPGAAAFVLDCTGRGGLLAREKGLRVYHDGPRTIALTGEWRPGTAWAVPDETHTIVESYGDGWMWSVPVAPGLRHVAAMIDPERSDLARGGSADRVYRAEIAKTREFNRLLRGATLRGGPWGFDASTYGARAYGGENWLLVGDAGSFIDPLSSAGVKKALASAWLAAVAVHTALTSPPMREEAFRFYADREREVEHHHSVEAHRYLSDAARRYDRPFWAERAAESTAAGDDAVARAAFERIRSQHAFAASAAPHLRIEPRPLVRGNLIALEPHVIDNGSPVRYLYGVDVLAMLELAPTVSQVPDLFEAYVRRQGAVPLHDFLRALATAVGRGFLVSEWRP